MMMVVMAVFNFRRKTHMLGGFGSWVWRHGSISWLMPSPKGLLRVVVDSSGSLAPLVL